MAITRYGLYGGPLAALVVSGSTPTVTHVTFDGSARIVVSPVFTGRIQTMAAFRGTVRIGGQSE